MSDILQTILRRKAEEIAEAKNVAPDPPNASPSRTRTVATPARGFTYPSLVSPSSTGSNSNSSSGG